MIELTESAAAHIKRVLEQEGGDLFKISLSQKGCSGYSYVMGVAKKADLGDEWLRHPNSGIEIAVRSSDAERLAGIRIDWVRDGLSSRLDVQNPQVVNACGCGASVMFKPKAP